MMNKWFLCATLLFGAIIVLLGLAQGCTNGHVRLVMRANYSGTLQYCYNDGHRGPEWINVCGRVWTGYLSQLACIHILHSSDPVQAMIIDTTQGSVTSRSISLNCTGQSQISGCSPVLLHENCSTVNVTCKGSCPGGRCTCSTGYGGFNCRDALCPSGCANGGRCIFPDECSCISGWQGDTCMTPICTHNCSNRGSCTRPNVCNCEAGWTGNDCTQAVCNPSCENGVCTTPDVCSCSPGWNGTICSQALCTQECMNGGNCTLPDVCTCQEDKWTGYNCTEAVCLPSCVNGECIAPNNCNCTQGWMGDSCTEAICTSPCINGNCFQPNNCTCDQGWTGPVCSEGICILPCENDGNCTAPGMCNCTSDWMGERCTTAVCNENFCLNGGTCSYPNVNCSCTEQWTGNNCQQAICVPPCNNGGECIRPDVCSCTADWKGERCIEAICREDFCQNGGNCTYPNINCSCTHEWMGNQCDIPICADSFCMNGGECLFPNTNCTCPPQWEGSQCDISICSDGFCLNEGNCSDPDVSCTCTEEWEGNQCRSAICFPNFCKNGGTCLFPNSNCTCPLGWNGDICEEVNYILLAVSLAALLVLLTIIFVIICTTVKMCKKSKKKDVYTRSIRRSLFGDNIKEISSPEVNPFLNGTSLRILNPQIKIPQWLQPDDDSDLKEVISKPDTQHSNDEITKKETPITKKETPESKTDTEKPLISLPGKESEPTVDDLQTVQPSKTTKTVKSELKTASTTSVLKSGSDNQEDCRIKTLQGNTKETKSASIEQSIPKGTQQKNEMLRDTRPFMQNKQEKQGEHTLSLLPSVSRSHGNHNIESEYDKLPSTPVNSSKKGVTESKSVPSNATQKQADDSSDVYAIPIIQKKKLEPKAKSMAHNMSIERDGINAKNGVTVEGSEGNEGYAIPIPLKKEEGKPRTVSVKDRRDTDAGYENPEPSTRSSKPSKLAASREKQNNSKSSVKATNASLSLHYAVSEEKKSAVLPPSDVQHQYHMLECAPSSSPSPLTKISGNRESPENNSSHQYFTLEAPQKTTSADSKTIANSSRASKRNKEQQSDVYHTLEPPAVKHRQVGSCRSVSANNHDTNTTIVSNYSDEYAVPIDHITKVTACDSKKQNNSHVYHILEKPN